MKNKFKLVFALLFVSSMLIAAETKITAEQVLDNVRKDLNSLEADFIQYETDANGNRSEDSTGKVWLNAPNQFKWEYQKPIPQLIVADGKQVWVYDDDLEQVTIKQQNSQQNPIYVLLNKDQTQEHYTVSLVNKVDTDTLQWIQMLPKKPNEDIKVVWLGVEKNNLVSLKLQNQLDNVVVFEFLNVKRNPKLADNFFNFKVPKGVEILRDGIDIGEF
jgi:outer membrane lipoprotein carrier protein